jgi:hypothetical protein
LEYLILEKEGEEKRNGEINSTNRYNRRIITKKQREIE